MERAMHREKWMNRKRDGQRKMNDLIKRERNG